MCLILLLSHDQLLIQRLCFNSPLFTLHYWFYLLRQERWLLHGLPGGTLSGGARCSCPEQWTWQRPLGWWLLPSSGCCCCGLRRRRSRQRKWRMEKATERMFSVLWERTLQSARLTWVQPLIVNRDGQTPAAAPIAISAICSKCCDPGSKPSGRGRRGRRPRLTVRDARHTKLSPNKSLSLPRRNFHQTAPIKRESLIREM